MPKNYTLDDILNEYSGEEKHKSAVKNKPAVKTEIKSNGQTGKIEDTGYIKIPSGGIPDETITYSVKELEQINAPAKRPSPSHRSGKFQVADISRPNHLGWGIVRSLVKDKLHGKKILPICRRGRLMK